MFTDFSGFDKFLELTEDERLLIVGGVTGQTIKHGRINLGLSQEELAEKFFVTQQAVSEWECGKSMPNVDSLRLLSELYQISLEEFLL